VIFHGRHEIVWVIPNFWTVVYVNNNKAKTSVWTPQISKQEEQQKDLK